MNSVKVSELVRLLEESSSTITICYASNGHHLYEGELSGIPKHLLEYFVTCIYPRNSHVYIECHESCHYLDN